MDNDVFFEPFSPNIYPRLLMLSLFTDDIIKVNQNVSYQLPTCNSLSHNPTISPLIFLYLRTNQTPLILKVNAARPVAQLEWGEKKFNWV